MITTICFNDNNELCQFEIDDGSCISMREEALARCPFADKIEFYEYGFTWILNNDVWELYNPDFRLIK